MKTLLHLLLFILVATQAAGQEFHFNWGKVQNKQTEDRSTMWSLAYMHSIGEHAMFSLTYLNEGHLPQNRRDGWSIQVWARKNIINRKLALSAGIGPYFYSNTTTARRGYYYDAHGWGGLFSMAATWYTDSRFLFQIRGNWVQAVHSINTLSLVGGIGYQLDSPPAPGPERVMSLRNRSVTGNQLAFQGGLSVLNGVNSLHAGAEALKYRKGLTRHLDWSVSLRNEGPRRDLHRVGVASQLWAVHAFFDDCLALGFGLGPFLAYDKYRGADGSTTVNALVSLTAAYYFSPHWLARISWDRVITNYSNDADVFLVGMGYRF